MALLIITEIVWSYKANKFQNAFTVKRNKIQSMNSNLLFLTSSGLEKTWFLNFDTTLII